MQHVANVTQLRAAPQQTAIAVFRTVQEAVTNALRHALAENVWIQLERHGDMVTIEIRDDGVGFEVSEAQARRPGMGLFTMRERLALVDGTFEITSSPGVGTTVIATISCDSRGKHVGS